ncbi:M14 family metallocarboxypeptidase [Paenibacillus sp. MBLB2552]|uniref:M14 family metallocarboxypeptidase n=1 Tax=Paenibacillus mellifer TaxID=2937794 RepID=A0A9X1XT99_9BACL|nr:M14 family metallocarboxypeptidase [Paenibacillus mellifer]MCK8485560.1 M14 family metallocarboxypeptidase [Paenibacillus mellifer]
MKSTRNRRIHKTILLILCLWLGSPLIASPREVQAAAAPPIVNPQQIYSYKVLTQDLEELATAYPNLVTYESIGTTSYGREIWAVKLGRGESTILLNGSHHAREWITTTLLMKMIDTYAAAYTKGSSLSNSYPVREWLDEVSIWVVPMVNPDGVTLAQQGTAGLPQSQAALLRKYNGNSSYFARWKANMDGIDLNRQYPAAWNTITQSTRYPWYFNYKGTRPAQTSEVQAMMKFTTAVDPELTISYHSSGEIIFWHFHTPAQNATRDRAMAADLGRLTGYSIVQPEKNPSGGGYKDWFVQQFGRPGFTIEVGKYAGESYVPLQQFNEIWADNREVGLYSAKQAYGLWLQKQKVQPVAESADLLVQTQLYPYPEAKTKLGALAAQEVEVTSRKGDWVEVRSADGNGWIHPAPGTVVKVSKLSATTDLMETTLTYNYPDRLSPATALPPQTVQVIGEWDEWLQISTNQGLAWIDGRHLELKPLPEVEESESQSQPGTLDPGEPEAIITTSQEVAS